MGIDWIRMRPRQSDSRPLLVELIKGQADEFRMRLGSVWTAWDFLGGPAAESSTEHVNGEQLLRRIEVNSGPGCCRRLAMFSQIEVIPAEWRLSAHRSHLPDEVPILLDTSVRHIEEVSRGEHRAHLAAWHAYLTIRTLREEWEFARSSALSAQERPHLWARKPGVLAAIEGILALPVPEASPPPHWGTEPKSPPPSLNWTDYADAARNWNEQVRSSRRLRLSPIQSFDEFTNEQLAADNVVHCLDWLEMTCRHGYGLWLDY
ncbi:hypothetical protein ACH35V_02085 [Actinomadura sp. 1N219]|uniref:hypothetical protein n=1 Tax=Actinomadura sp. 1N219 TaxID=3375152 RepID=UPI00379396EF